MKLLLTFFLASTAIQQAYSQNTTATFGGGIISLHGSGTTNPSRCYWSILKELTAQARIPLHLTYRAIGSSNGQKELLGGPDSTVADIPANHFGSGDVPTSESRFAALQDAGVEMLHFPVLTGAVNFFHSIPDTPKLNLTGALLARIYSFDIENWNHEDIAEINPDLDLSSYSTAETVISTGRRVHGSSSTAAATGFLHAAAGDMWPDEQAGSAPVWPQAPASDRVMECQGSGGMTDCLVRRPFSIGYIDAGHGVDAGLQEVRIENLAGVFLNTREALANGGFATAEKDVLPASADADFSAVSLINRPGEFTWPMTSLTYVYVRKNLNFLSADQRGILVTFLRALYNEDYVQRCADDYGFLLPAEEIRSFGENAINELLTANPGTNEFTFEKKSDTRIIDGMGEYVISAKRMLADSVLDEDELADAVIDLGFATVDDEDEIVRLGDAVASLEMEVETKNREIAELRDIMIGGGGAGGLDDDEASQLKTALVLGTLSFVFWGIFLIGYLAKSLFLGKHDGASP